MKGKLYCILVSFGILVALTICKLIGSSEFMVPTPGATQPTASIFVLDEEPEVPSVPAQSQRDRDWVEDIEYLRTEYKEKHLDPFYYVSEEEFDWRVDQMISRVSELSNEDSSYQDGYEQFASYLLHEIVSVNGIDITYLNQKATEQNNPFNHWFGKELFPDIFLPAFFDWAGCDYKEGYTIQFLNDNREIESVEVPVISLEELSGNWVRPGKWDSLSYRKGGNWAE